MKIIKNLPQEEIATNSFIVITDEKNAVLIDAPFNARPILDTLIDGGYTLKKILLTHGHFDHVSAVSDLVDATGAEVYIHTDDMNMLSNPQKSLAHFFCYKHQKPFDKAIAINDGDILKQDKLEFKVMSTPGHSDGSVCYFVGDIMFAGDTVFYNSIGRTDAPGGDYNKMTQSLKKIKQIEKDYTIYTGHGPSTSLDFEKKTNPFFNLGQ